MKTKLRALTRVRNLLVRVSHAKALPTFIRHCALAVGLRLAPMTGGADSTTAQHGAGDVLSFWNTAASPDAYAALGQIRSINGVGVTKSEIDSTTLDSTAMEYIGGLANGDSVTIVFTTGAASTNIDRIRGWVDGTDEIDFKWAIKAPASETLFFSVTPLHYDLGNSAPNALREITFSGRITGGVGIVDPHA